MPAYKDPAKGTWYVSFYYVNWKGERERKLFMSTRNFTEAMRLAPQRVEAVFTEIFQKDREEREARRNTRRKTKHRDERER